MVGAMQTLGTGRGVALWFNLRAKRVNAALIDRFREVLPDATIYATQTLDDARAAARQMKQTPPELLLCGGGDGTIVRLLNFLREAGVSPFPRMALMKLGTGNAWPLEVTAPDFKSMLPRLPQLKREAVTTRFSLVDVEGTLTHFIGAGWDATMLNDYKRNLERRKTQPLASRLSTRLHTGLFGYLYTIARITVPEQAASNERYGRAMVSLENLGHEVYTLDRQQRPLALSANLKQLYSAPLAVVAVSTISTWGAGFKAPPHARLMPGLLNVRFFDEQPMKALLMAPKLWQGAIGDPRMTDFFVTRGRLHFSRPQPYQVGGDVHDACETVDFKLAEEHVDVVEWPTAFAA